MNKVNELIAESLKAVESVQESAQEGANIIDIVKASGYVLEDFQETTIEYTLGRKKLIKDNKVMFSGGAYEVLYWLVTEDENAVKIVQKLWNIKSEDEVKLKALLLVFPEYYDLKP